MRNGLAAAMLVGLLLAGCLSSSGGRDGGAGLGLAPSQRLPDGSIDYAGIAAAIGEPIVLDHEHTDAAQHTGRFNLKAVGWSPLSVTPGANGFANFVLWTGEGAGGPQTLAFVAIDGDSQGGFDIVDIADPTRMAVLGSYRASGSGFQEVRVTPDGRFAVLNVQKSPTVPGDVVNGECPLCIHVVNVQDRANPQLEFILPVETRGTHNMDIATYDGVDYVFFVGQPVGNEPPGNRVGIARLQEAPGVRSVEPEAGMTLVPVGTFSHPAVLDDGRSYPHDVLVQGHPDGRRIAYVSHWDGGAVTFDVSNPLDPRPLGVNAEQAPSSALAIHWLMQEPARRADGRVIAWSVPEIGTLPDGTGVLRAYDATDPAALQQIGTWALPGDLRIDGRYILSPHVALPDQATGLLALSHYHAGVWVLDMTKPEEPRALGYYLPHGAQDAPHDGEIWWKKPNFSPDGYLPNVYMARWHDGLLWVTERGTGLYALRYTGPVPGPVT